MLPMSYQNEHTMSDLLQAVFDRLNLSAAADEIEVKQAYNAAVGDLISKLTWSLHYDNHTLFVRLVSAALRQELSFHKQGLIDRINNLLNRCVVHNIVFQ